MRSSGRSILVSCCFFLLASCGGNRPGETSASTTRLLGLTSTSNGTATFSGNRSTYRIYKTSTGYTVTDSANVSSVLSSATQALKFDDVTINLGIGDKSRTIAAADLKLLTELYIAFFNRVPDADGLSYWIDQFNGGRSIDLIAESFYDAALQFSSITGYTSSMTNSDFVKIIYKNVLGRSGATAPPDADVAYWAGELTNGNKTRGSLIRFMLGSAHSFANDATWGWVASLLDNKYTVGNYFAVQEGLNYNTPQDSITNTMAIAAAVTSSDTLDAISRIGITDTSFDLLTPATAAQVSSTSSGTGVTVTTDKSYIAFNGFAGYSAVPQSVKFTLASGSLSGTYYAIVTVDKPSAIGVSVSFTSSTTAVATLTPINPAAGSVAGNMTFYLCKDSQCATVVWSKTMPYSMSYYSIGNSSIALTGYEGAGYVSRSVSISPADTNHQLLISTNVSGGGQNWLSASHASDSAVQIGGSGIGMKAGSYQGTIYVTFTGDGSSSPALSIPVSFTVGAGTIAPPAASVDLTATSSASPTGSLAVAFNGTQSPAWSAVSDQPWLILIKASGTGAGNLEYSIDTSKLGSLANWSSTTANVKISATGLSDVTTTVTLNKKLPIVSTVSPNPVTAGSAASVKISGKGFSQLAAGSAIQIGTATGTVKTILSDTEAMVSVPALATGSYAISVANASNTSAAGSTIYAVSPVTMSYATVADAGQKRSMVFDATRNAAYAPNTDKNTLTRYRYSGGTWQVDALSIASVGDLALSPDKKTLFVISGTYTLLAIDPDTLQIKNTYTSVFSLMNGRFTSKGLAVTSNGRIWFTDSGWTNLKYFDIASATFGSVGNSDYYNPTFYSPPDGSQLVVANSVLSPPLNNSRYTPDTDTVASSTSMPVIYYDVMFSNDGAKMLADSTTLYDGNTLTSLGKLPAATGIVLNSLVSPDGTRIYLLVTASNNSLTANHVDVIDTMTLTKAGQIAVSDQALDCGTNPAYGCDLHGAFTISPFGNTLFWAGNKQLVVIPIPSSVSGQASASRVRLTSPTVR
jgi:hypothetical protein